MTKEVVDKLISNMKKAGIVTKASAWGVEGIMDKQMNVRYVGLRLLEWEEIISSLNNLMLKFVTSKTESFFELYLANKPPFIRILRKNFAEQNKWEVMLGEIKSKLRRDKEEYIHHKAQIGNLYTLIFSSLKK